MAQISTQWILFMALFVTMTFQLTSADTIDPGEDFGGYVEEIQRMEFEDALYEAKLNAHEQWRQTTWSGTAVRKIQGLALHFKPFLLAVQEALEDTTDEDGTKSMQQIMAYIGIRMLFVVLLLLIIYVGSKLFQLMVGGDIEIVEEVIIVHEHETEADAQKARQKTTRSKRKKQTKQA